MSDAGENTQGLVQQMLELKVRSQPISDVIILFSVYDFIQEARETTNNNAMQIWTKLLLENKDELEALVHEMEFPTYKTPGMTITGLMTLMLMLPGTIAASFRREVLSIYTRYIAGDQTLHAEIDANAASSGPMQQLIRNELNLVLKPMIFDLEDALKLELAKIREDMAMAFQLQTDHEFMKTNRELMKEKLMLAKAENVEMNLRLKTKQVEADETIKTTRELHNKLQQQEETERIRLLKMEHVYRGESIQATKKRMVNNEAVARCEKMVASLKEEVKFLQTSARWGG